MRWSLKILIPTLLLAAILVQGVVFFVYSSNHISRQLLENTANEVRSKLTLLQSNLEDHLAKREFNRVQEQIAALGGFEDLIAAILVSPENRVLASTRLSNVGQYLEEAVLPAEVKEILTDNNISQVRLLQKGIVINDENFHVVTGIYPITMLSVQGTIRPNKNGLLIIAQDLLFQQEKTREYLLTELSMTGVVVLIVAAFAGFTLHLVVSRRITELVSSASELANGNYAVRVTDSGYDEIARLSSAFNNMTEQISKSRKNLIEQKERVELLMNSTAEAIYGIDSQGRCTFVNPACLTMLGYDNENELIGENMHQKIHHSFESGEVYPEDDCPISKTLKDRKNKYSSDAVFWRKNGTMFAVEYWSHPIIANNELKGSVVTFLDITERKKNESSLQDYRNHLEDLVEERTEQLKTINRELESYSYSIAHDLRTPLRSVVSYCQIIKEEESDRISKQSLDMLARVIAAGKYMAELIDDILCLAKVTRVDLQKSDSDISMTTSNVCSEMDNKIKNKVSWHVQDGLRACVDIKLFEVVMYNLLNNACKFTKDQGAEIEFGMKSVNGDDVFYVSDNGIGFDMQYAHKIFGPFQRLHLQDEYEGTGVGLTTVQRIIERHGGRIWVKSSPGEGSTFYFTLQ